MLNIIVNRPMYKSIIGILNVQSKSKETSQSNQSCPQELYERIILKLGSLNSGVKNALSICVLASIRVKTWTISINNYSTLIHKTFPSNIFKISAWGLHFT